jgi:nicotinamidase-related amidase
MNLLICALCTEACLAFPTLDAIEAGYQVYPVVDAVGPPATSNPGAHNAATSAAA